MALLVSIILSFGGSFLFAYLLYWLDRYEKEPLPLLGGVFLWGAVVAAAGAFVLNTLLALVLYIFTGSEGVATELGLGSLIAPAIEETLKGVAVLIVFLVFRREFDSVLDGIIYAGIVALGFSATENAYYMMNYGYQENGWSGLFRLAFVRMVLVGWQHPFYTAFTGVGLALARLSRRWVGRLGAPLLGLSLALFTHAIHNGLAIVSQNIWIVAFFDWNGWLFMVGVLLWATYQESRYLRKHLWPEVQAGVISARHYQTASSAWLQMTARISSLCRGNLVKTSRFYQLCGELAHKKQQLLAVGEEDGNLAIIQNLRAELARLAPSV